MIRWREDKGARIQHVRQGAGIVLGIGALLGEGDVPGRADEVAELAVGDRRAVDPEPVDGDAVDRRLFWIMPVRAHAERAAGNPDHVGVRVILWRMVMIISEGGLRHGRCSRPGKPAVSSSGRSSSYWGQP